MVGGWRRPTRPGTSRTCTAPTSARFRVPADGSTPAIDYGGYVAYWVRPSAGGQNAAIIQLEINDPQATPQVLRTLGSGTAEALSLAPDNRGIAVVVDGAVHLVSINGSTDEVVPNPRARPSTPSGPCV